MQSRPSRPEAGTVADTEAYQTLMTRRRQCFPSPEPHDVFGQELVAQVAREAADLASVMRVMLQEIREHVDRAAWHPLDARLATGQGGLEQAREILRGLTERAPRLHGGRAIAIE